MSVLKRKKGQSSTEFIIVAGTLFLILIGVFFMVQRQMANAKNQRIYDELEELGDLIRTEIQNARASSGTYTREFFIPETVDGKEYILFNNEREIIIKFIEYEHIIFLEHNLSGDIQKGANVIHKQGNTVNYTLSINT